VFLQITIRNDVLGGGGGGGEVIERKMYFDFSATFAWKFSHSKKNSARYQECT